MAGSNKKRRRRKKRANPLLGIVAFLMMAAVAVILVLVLRGGYHTLMRSTYELAHQETVMKACEDFDVEPALVYAIMRTESKFNENALSSAEAMGLMQVTEISLEWLQYRSDEFKAYTVDQLYDPDINIRCGVYMLNLLEEQFESEQAVIAAYNAGIGIVQEWLQDEAYSSDGVTLHTVPYDETRAYIERVQDAKAIYEDYYQL